MSSLISSIVLDRREILLKKTSRSKVPQNNQGVGVCVCVSKQPLKLTFYAVMEARANAG